MAKTKGELNARKEYELAKEELANVVGGCGEDDDDSDSSSGPIETEGVWKLCEGKHYISCGYDRVHYSESATACGNCTRFTPNSANEWSGSGVCSGY